MHHPLRFVRPGGGFLAAAARDPDVLAIKQTLYRVGRNSPVVNALLEARENGKQVAVLVELKARFDEESNIAWARTLEREGVHVIYGLLGLKTHSKIALVVRKEGDRIRRYIHLATGNYNAITAQLYEISACSPATKTIGADATDLFNYLTGYSAKKDYRKLMVAPINLREGMEALIEREIEHQQQKGERPSDLQDERPRGRADDPAAVPRLAGRGQGRPDRARHLLPAAGRRGVSARISASSASSGVSWNTAGSITSTMAAIDADLPGQRRPDAAQHQPPGGSPLPGGGSAPDPLPAR